MPHLTAHLAGPLGCALFLAACGSSQPAGPAEPPAEAHPGRTSTPSDHAASSVPAGTRAQDPAAGEATPPPPPPPGSPGSPGFRPLLPPEPPLPPQNVVPPAKLETQRIAGTTSILPSDTVIRGMQDAGTERVVAVEKMCLDAQGVVASLARLKSSGFPSYDRAIEHSMRDWRYKPYLVNGHAVPVCTSVTFIYRPPPKTPPSK